MNGATGKPAARLRDAAIVDKSFLVFEAVQGGPIAPPTEPLGADRCRRQDVPGVGHVLVPLHIVRIDTSSTHGWQVRFQPPSKFLRRPSRDDASRRGLRVFDNSWPRESGSVALPPPRELLHVENGRLLCPKSSELGSMPNSAKPIVEAAIETFGATSRQAMS